MKIHLNKCLTDTNTVSLTCTKVCILQSTGNPQIAKEWVLKEEEKNGGWGGGGGGGGERAVGNLKINMSQKSQIKCNIWKLFLFCISTILFKYNYVVGVRRGGKIKQTQTMFVQLLGC